MSTYNIVFKQEVIRLAKHEIKKAITPLLATIRRQRQDIAKLKQENTSIKQQVSRPVEPTVPGVTDKELKKARFSGGLIRKFREKLGLTRDQFGKLIGVTGYAVIPWETNQCRPNVLRQKAIVALRKMGKREVMAMVKAGKTVVG